MSVILERWQAGMLAGSVVVAGIAVAGGAFLGGYALGDTPTPSRPTELAEKTYAAQDLEAALAACEIKGVPVEAASVTLIGGEHSSMRRGCFVEEMGAPPIAQHEYGWSNFGTPKEHYIDGGEYSWSNLHMVWEQTEEGRDVTITVAK